jgi:5-methylcytosine-specific restriction endonuclease McrA
VREYAVKLAVRERDGNCCTECGMTKAEHIERYRRNLEVHRLTPGSVYTVDGCVLLCKECHRHKPRSPHGTRPYMTVMLPGRYRAALERVCPHLPMCRKVRLALDLYLESHGLPVPKVARNRV